MVAFGLVYTTMAATMPIQASPFETSASFPSRDFAGGAQQQTFAPRDLSLSSSGGMVLPRKSQDGEQRALAQASSKALRAAHSTKKNATAQNQPQQPAPACLYALDPSATGALYISGSTSITTSCSAAVESSASQAFQMTGSETVYLTNNAQVGVVGGWSLASGTSIVNKSTGQKVSPVTISSPGDPLAFLPAPTQGTIVGKSHTYYDMNSRPPNNTIAPGVYCGGLTIGNTNGATFTMSPGTYIMAGGGLTLNSLAVVSGSGVAVYNTSSTGWGCSSGSSYTPITISGQANVALSAPTTGALADVLFFGDRAGCSTLGSCQDQINGGSATTFNGAMYFKSDTLLFSGATATGCMMAVADKLNINGNTSFSINGCSGVFGGVTVSVAPTTATLYAAQSQQFSATVTNTSNTSVNWSLSPSIGTINSSGLYTAPSAVTSQQTVTVTATSQAEPSISASATVTLMPPVSVAIAPLSATLYGGQTQQFSATVSNSSNTAVSWSISPTGVGSVSSSGLYSAPATITSQQTVTVTATSQAYPSASASATVTLMPPVSVSVSPSSANLYPGQTQQFTASVSNSSNKTVTWSIAPSGVGTINSAGLYTAPASITKQQTVSVTATSQADTTKSASASVTINVPLPTITSITTPVAPGGPVTITGQNFLSTAGTVTLNGVTLPATSWTNTSISLQAPTNNCTGSVAVTTQYGTSNSVTLTITGTQVGCMYPPPTANAGSAQTVPIGATVQLDGTGSTDQTGTQLTYSWSFVSIPSGSAATLTSPTSPKPTFVADVYGNYTVQLVVNDGYHSSAPNQVVISTQDSAPVANAGQNQTVPVQTLVQLSGSGSSDVDGNPLTYSWSFVSMPTGSKSTLTNPTSVNPSFTTDKVGSYVVQLVVNDGILNSAPATVTISSQDVAPVANAGQNQTVTVGTTVQLNGSGSTDVDGNPLTYHWSFLSIPTGSSAVLSNASIVNPTFVADVPGNFVVQLIVNDGILSSAPSTVTIGNSDIAPIANAGNPQTVSLGAQVTLDGTGSTDSDNKPLTYQWSLLSVPSGSTATLSQATSANPTFTADLAGNYIAQLIVNDGFLSSSPSTVMISTSHSVPIANAGQNQTVTVGATVQLSGSASSDVDGYPLTYRWAMLSQPSGGTATLSSSTVVNPTFIANVVGAYVVQLIVNDGVYDSAPVTAMITANLPVPVVNAGTNQTITLPVNSVTLTGSATDNGYPLTFSWTVVSGSGSVTFGNANSAGTSATFSAAGTYVLQLTASNGQTSGSATTTITVNASVVQPPVVNAGSNQTITLPTDTVTLNGSATDNGLPLTFAWTMISGPANVSFSSPNTPVTQATFWPTPGVYVLQLSASNGQMTGSAQVTITVQAGSGTNQAPVVNAGPNQTLTLPATTLTLFGSATDDGLPKGVLVASWSQVSGPGSVTFSNPSQPVTQTTFNAPGLYDLRLTGNDTQLTSTSDTLVYVYPQGTNGQNEAPYVNAGPDQSIVLPAVAQLNGTVIDPYPAGNLSISWSMVSGPGSVTFSAPTAASTTASFSIAGNYVLQLAASDGVSTATSTLNVAVGKLFGHMSNKGTDFWLMFPRNSDNGSVGEGFQPELIITSDTNNSGTVTIPGLGFSTSYTIAAGQSTIVQIPITAAADATDAVEHKGIHVTSASEVTIVGLSFEPYTTDGYLALPTPVIGTDYVVPAYPQEFIGVQGPNVFYGGSEFALVASQDGTTVTITPSVNTTGRIAGQPYQVVLNQGRTYQLYAADARVDLTGTQITSNKPIAVYGGASCSNVPFNNNLIYKACNHLVEQIPPTSLWGENFVVEPFAQQPAGSLIRILAATDGTTVSVNGISVATLNRGEYYDNTISPNPLVIAADQPVLVVQIMTSTDYQSRGENILGDPSMQLIPAYEQFGGQYVIVTPTIPTVTGYTGIPESYLNIVAPTASVSSVQVDGVSVNASSFAPIGSSTFSGTQFPSTTGVHHVTANAPLGVSLYGMGSADAYSYQAGVVFDSAPTGSSIVLTPTTTTQQTGTILCLTANVLDQFGRPAGGIGVSFSVTGANPSSVYVDTNAFGSSQYCYPGTSAGTDSVVSSVGLASATGAVNWSASAPNAAPSVYAGPNQMITLPNTANLGGVATDDGLPGGPLSITWSQLSGPGTVSFAGANQAATTATFSSPGTYVLTLSANDSQLTSTSNVTITVLAAPQSAGPVVNAGQNQTITLPTSTVTLTGTVTDNTVPTNALLSTQWTEVSGPSGTGPELGNPVVFSNSTNLTTQATFVEAGTYVLQLAADDSVATNSSTVTIAVNPAVTAPSVNPGGPYQTTLPANTVTLNATVTDAVMPAGGTLTSLWAEVSGPAQVTFANATQPTTQATFPVAGQYLLTISASNGLFTTTYNAFVNVYPAAVPPVVSINPSYQTIELPTNTATLSGTVTDSALPAGGTLTQVWSLQSGPVGVTFGSPTQPTTTVTFSAPGTYSFVLTASNSQMIGSATATVVVTGGSPVNNPDQPPSVSITGQHDLTIPANSETLTGVVTDSSPVTVTVSWNQVNGPAPVTFSTTNQTVTQVTFPSAGTYQLRFSASDGTLTSYADTYISVNPQGAPTASISPSVATIILPANITLTANGSDPNGLPLTYQWANTSTFAQATFSAPNSATTQVSFQTAGLYFLQVVVSNGILSTTAGIGVNVQAQVPGPPQVSLTTPQADQNITAPVTVFGSISGAQTNTGSVTYTLAYSLNTQDGASTQSWVPFASGVASVGINTGNLGTLDPTAMLNGSYTLRLLATDNYGQTGTATTTFTVSKNMKVGNFTMSFTDLNVPVAGLPITVTRTYDSRDQNFRDFGPSWSLGIANVQIQKNRVLGKSWNESFNGGGFNSYCLQSINNITATVTFPDGKQYNFQAVSKPQCQQAAPITAPTLGFAELPGSPGTDGATLVPADGGAVLVDNSVPGNVNLIDYNSLPYNPTVFILTTREGYKYTIDQNLGVTNMSDPNGNTLTISSSGVVSSTGKSISFTRDSSNRITQITDPNGNTLKYSYNYYGYLSNFTDAVGNQTTFYYNNNGQPIEYLQQIIDPRGVVPVTAYYDSGNHLQKLIDANGKTINFNNNLTGQVETITDRLGNPTIYSYDSDGNILTMTDALGNTTTYTYDSNDDKLTETNALGKTTTYTYDGIGNKLTETDPLGNTTKYTYDIGGRVLNVTDPLGHVTANVYDSSGNLTSTTDANGKNTSTVYNPNGLPQTVTDANGKTTQFQYDGSGNLTQQTDALGNLTAYTYDANNNKLSQTVTRSVNGQPQSITTNYKYDGSNRLTETDYADGTKTQVQYNSIGKQSVTIDQLNRQTSYTYDSTGRLTTTTYPDNTTDSATFDAENNRLTSTDRVGNTTTYTYDVDKRLTKTTYADNSFTQTNYDAAGRASSTVDANGNTTTYGYDDSGRRTSLTDALNHITAFTYDNSGNQTAVKDARQNTTQYQYDLLNRQIAVIYPDETTATTAYDNLSRIVSTSDQAGKVTGYGYDARGRLTSVTQDAVPGGLNLVTQYGYDEVGNRISQTDANNHTTTYSYDQLGRRIGRTLPAGQSESYVYDNAGNLKQKTDFNGKTTTYAYDSSNRLLSKTPDGSFNAPADTFTYYNNGLRHTMADVSGTTTYRYDNRNRLTSKQTPFGTLGYTYDSAGNLLTLTSSNTNGASLTYAYDVLNRLSTVTDNRLLAQGATSGVTTYNYDAVGNLQNFTYPNGVVHAYTYDALNRLTQMGSSKNSSSAISNYAYTLGAAGNRTSVAELTGRTVAYAYDSLYRLTSETVTADPNNKNGVVGYTYDNVGNRMTLNSTLPPSGAINYTYDADDRLGFDQYDPNGNTVSGVPVRTYSYGLERISETQTLEGALTTSFYGYDGQGSVRQLTNSTGTVSDTYNYDAFGNLINVTGTTPNNYLFSAEQYDPALNLYYNRARYLNTATGRFWNMDTYEGDQQWPASLHKYLYVDSDPVNKHDPSGQLVAEEEAPAQTIENSLDDEEANLYRQVAAQISRQLLRRGLIFYTGIVAFFVASVVPDPSPDPAQNIEPVQQQQNPQPEAEDEDGDSILLYRTGSSPNGPNPGPAIPRILGFNRGVDETFDMAQDSSGNVVGQGQWPDGASTNKDSYRLRGNIWGVPKGAVYSQPGLGVIADGSDAVPPGPRGPGHHTIYPTEPMTSQQFVDRFLALPWSFYAKQP